METNFKASVVITTRNRKDELRKAVRSCLAQKPCLEVIVIDDGSVDGTNEMVTDDFPSVRFIRHETSAGYIVRRNEGARLSKTPIIVFIDDDAEFSSPHVVAQTVRDFQDDRVGAVAIPFINVYHSPKLLQRAPDESQIWIADSFVGTAHALRRDLFQRLEGFWEPLVHQGEESDYCIRMLDSGHVVSLGRADPILHYLSSKRDISRMGFYGKRNNVLFAWRNVPLAFFPAHIIGTIANSLIYTLRSPVPWHDLKGLGASILYCVRLWKERRPVCSATYLRFRTLRKEGPKRLNDLVAL